MASLENSKITLVPPTAPDVLRKVTQTLTAGAVNGVDTPVTLPSLRSRAFAVVTQSRFFIFQDRY